MSQEGFGRGCERGPLGRMMDWRDLGNSEGDYGHQTSKRQGARHDPSQCCHGVASQVLMSSHFQEGHPWIKKVPFLFIIMEKKELCGLFGNHYI